MVKSKLTAMGLELQQECVPTHCAHDSSGNADGGRELVRLGLRSPPSNGGRSVKYQRCVHGIVVLRLQETTDLWASVVGETEEECPDTVADKQVKCLQADSCCGGWQQVVAWAKWWSTERIWACLLKFGGARACE